MSIAVTVVIAPSRCLRCLLAGFGASLLAAACAVGLATPPAFALAPYVAAALLFAGACVLHGALGRATVHRIDISGPGKLRLTVQQGVRQDKFEALPATLSAGSTLWPRMLMLCLEMAPGGSEGGAQGHVCTRWMRRRPGARLSHRRSLAVLPDSLPPEAFRALAVALGAGSQACGATSTEHKIL